MNPSVLFAEVLALRLRLDLCPPAEAELIQPEINGKVDQICLLAKVAEQRVRNAISDQYPTFVKAEHAKGNLIQSPATMIQIPPVE